jgi:hypothetical protein
LEKEAQFKALWQSAAVCFGIIIGLLLLKGSFSFAGANDGYFRESYGPAFVDALKEDRMTLYSADLLRSGFLILLVAGVLWLFIKNKLAQNTAIILVGLLMIFDLFFVDKKYVSGKDFVSKREVEVPFQETPADAQILQDTTHYRVFEVSGNMSSARASYFHKSIGGYSAVKPRRMQQLFDYQIAKNNIEMLNMLNVKYIIQTDSTGVAFPVQNPNANGNAWFVLKIQNVNSADEEMKSLDKINTKDIALIGPTEVSDSYSVASRGIKNNFTRDSLATIKLDLYKPNHLKYTSSNPNDGFAVFSEVYYKDGWEATIDGKETTIYRVDYTLRGLDVPAGKHTIEFKFEPKVVQTGSIIALFSSLGMLFLLIGGVYLERKKSLNLKS